MFSGNTKYSEAPWITKGLQNACKKKNKLYKDVIKHRPLDVENKLTASSRIVKQEYYSQLLDRNKKNMKGIWKVRPSVICHLSGDRVAGAAT